MGTQLVMVKWDHHHPTLLAGLQQLLFDETFTDVTLVCEDSSLKTHKVFLAALSSFFQSLFTGDFRSCHTVNIRNIKCSVLKDIITLLYHGEVNLYEDRLPEFFKVAELLQVKGFVESSKYISANKNFVNNEEVNVEFIEEETVAHQQMNSSSDPNLKWKEESSQKSDDEFFVDASALLKQEIIEKDTPIFPYQTFTKKEFDEKPEEISLLNKSLGIQEACCSSPAYNDAYSKTDNHSKKQNSEDDPAIDILYRSMNLRSQQSHVITDQCQEATVTGNSNNTSTETERKGNKATVNNLQDSKQTTKRKYRRSRKSWSRKPKKPPISSRRGKEIKFRQWFNKVKKNCSKEENLQSQVKESLSFCEDIADITNYGSDSKDSSLDGTDAPCPMPDSQWKGKEKSTLKCQVRLYSEKDNYNCDTCCRKFTDRISYLMHLKNHYDGIYNSLSCTCKLGKCKHKKAEKTRKFYDF